jgi:DNA-binding CsgD family transcriptional regulator/methanogenic corrinoid protein MtbC1
MEHRLGVDASMSARAAQAGFLRDALRAGDAGSAESAALLLLAGGMPLIDLYDRVVRSFIAEIGRDFADGSLRLVDEHVTTRAAVELVTLLCRRQMPWTGDGAHGGAERGVIVLGAAPREQHVLGVRMLAQVLQVRGWKVHLLDSLPYEDLASFCRSLPALPDAVGLTLHALTSTTSLRAGLTLFRETLPDVPVVLGGAAVAVSPSLAAKVGAAAGAADLAEGVHAIEAVTNPLTRRERQILGLVAAGASNSEIAMQLSVHSSTVKTHLEHVAGKLGTSDRTAAAVQGLRRGWID